MKISLSISCLCLGSLMLLNGLATGASFRYKKCDLYGTHTIWLLDGWCTKGCEQLRNCTTVYGNIIVRPAFKFGAKVLKKQENSYPALREITGYLIVVFIKEYPGLPKLFPSLAVIRGMQLLLHYALVFYRTELQKVNLPALTVIKSGGVRIDHNDKMCYLETIRWKSIVLEKTQTKENFGIAFDKNNKNCYDKCYSRKCFAPSGHGNARQQYCWGPGNKEKGDFECQKFCADKCGSRGCLGSTTSCCHPSCLGGCTKTNSDFHCFACKKFRSGAYGKCVEKCPRGMYVNNNFECVAACPWWSLWNSPFNFPRYYIHQGHCVSNCPAGYFKNSATKTCDKCLAERCPRVCPPQGYIRTVRIEGLSDAQKYKGCTEIRGNISIEIRAGPADTVEKLKEYLGAVEIVRGYIEIRESKALGTLSFFENLQEISPKYLYQNEFALAVFRNMNLKSLWKPKKRIKVSSGELFFHTNPYLCPKVIKELQSFIGRNRTDAISETMNGYMTSCNVKKFNITIYEVKNRSLCSRPKCVNVTWYHERLIDSRNLFYSVNYRVVLKDDLKYAQSKDKCGNIKWETVEVPVPGVVLNQNSTGQIRVEMHALLQNLSAYQTYAIYVETYVLNGEGRLSDESRILLSESIPRRPLALEATYLSSSEIKLKWNPPDKPNGIITKWQIFFQKNFYSFWRSNLDWCQRDVTHDVGVDAEARTNTSMPNGSCPTNRTCSCEVKKEESRKLKQDRNNVLFQKSFEDKIFAQVFSKPKDNEDDDDKKNKVDDDDDDDKGKKKNSIKEDDDKKKKFVKVDDKKKLLIKDDEKKKIAVKAKTSAQQPTVNPDCTKNPYSSKCNTPTRKGLKKEATSTTKTATKSPPTLTSAKLTRTQSSSLKPTSGTPKDEKLVTVNGTTFQLILKDLAYYQEYKIRVCPCNRAGCGTNLNCAVVFGRTDVNTIADNIPEPVNVKVEQDMFNVSWRPPRKPNGIVLRYDVGIRFNKNRENIQCQLASLHTFVLEKRVAPGNYTIRIRAIAPASNGSWTTPVSFIIQEKQLYSPRSNTVIIGIGTAAAFVIMMLILVVVYYAYVKKTSQMGVPGVLYASVNPEYLNSNEVYIPDEWEVSRDKIELMRELGKGSFGMVYEGIAYGIIEEEQKLKVAVKTVNENASIRDRIEFLQEASIMKAFNCNHIVRLLGVVSQGQPTLVVMELMERGDLKTFLRSRRPEEKGGLLPPNLAEILQMAAEIADGMSYLAARKFVHRDLAARNCMVAADFTVKIGDFGMTRDIYETDYYRKGGKGLLPVRWMAPESLKDGIFTTASDVWSNGVVLWEMATLAAQPYPGKSNEDVLRFVIEGGVLEQPDDCPDRLYNMMCNCWKTDPRARPSFLELVQFLENDVNDTFEEVSYYHEMKRKLLEATETNLLKGPNDQVNQARHNSLKMTGNMVEGNVSGSVTSDSAGDENWKTEADQGLTESDDVCSGGDGRSKSMYDNDGDAVNMRYVELPTSSSKSKKGNNKPVPV